MCSPRLVTVLLAGVLVQFVGCAGSQDEKLDEAISALKSLNFVTNGEMTEEEFQKDWKKLNLAFNEVKSTGPEVDKVKEIIAIWKKVDIAYDNIKRKGELGGMGDSISIRGYQAEAKRAMDKAGF